MAASFAAQAQTARRIRINVPFDFVVGKQTLPAGTYTIRQMLRDNDSLLLLQSTDGRTTESVLTNRVEAGRESAAARLDFHRYGDTNFLFRVWTPGTESGRELPKSKSERVRVRELARGAKQSDAAPPQTVFINGRME
jgi:hypothetical protein